MNLLLLLPLAVPFAGLALLSLFAFLGVVALAGPPSPSPSQPQCAVARATASAGQSPCEDGSHSQNNHGLA
jgi:hypothetical protein